MPSETDVIIIGAGAAGLSAAKALDHAGLSYQVFEAAPRIGGRAASEEIAPGEWFDRGCSWLMNGEENPFTAIARDMGIELATDIRDRFKLESLRFVRDGAHLSEAGRRSCVDFYNASNAAITAAAEQGRDVALSEVIDVKDDFAQPFLTSVDTSWGKSVTQVSTRDHASSVGDLGYQARRGYGNLVAAWGADVPVSLATQVKRVDWSKSPITVETNKGAITAKTILVTVSTGVLASQAIAFHPALPDWKEDALHNLPMGTENKIGIHFDRDVFGDDGRAYYTAWSHVGGAAKVDASVMGLNTAVVLVGGERGLALEREGPRAFESFAMDRVIDIFGSGIRKHAKRTLSTAWKSDPWVQGSWACAKPGQAHQRTHLACPVGERLFFAGEATMIGSQGSCHGAYQSGVRAAQEIAVALHRADAKAPVQ
ncbi:MAG: NAD(P)/FAD-dependent oxidoreductase [Roseovarius sp.]